MESIDFIIHTILSMRNLLYIALLLILPMFISCKSTQQVVERTDSLIITKPVIVTNTVNQHTVDIVRDTVMQKDSTYIIQRGDTIYHHYYHTTNNVSRIYRTDTLHDTIERPIIDTVVKVRTITKTNTVIKEVPRQLTRWQSIKMNVGGIAMVTVVVLLTIIILKKYGNKLRKFIHL